MRCTTCRHFRPANDDHSLGTCIWKPTEQIPGWLDYYLEQEGSFYGPRTTIFPNDDLRDCKTYQVDIDRRPASIQ